MQTEFLMAAAGGVLIGAASVMLMWLNGRIAGISGILYGAFSRSTEQWSWRLLFIVGLVLGGFIFVQATGLELIERQNYPLALSIVAGLLVGLGTRLGSGCTSGHGICGISRFSVRSVVATAVFVALGIVTATSVHFIGSVL